MFCCERNSAVKTETSKCRGREYMVVSCFACFKITEYRSHFGSPWPYPTPTGDFKLLSSLHFSFLILRLNVSTNFSRPAAYQRLHLKHPVYKLFGRPGFSHFTYSHFSGCRHRRILPTSTDVSGCSHRRIRVVPTQTFRVAGVLHFTYTHFSGCRGVAFYLHTLSGRLLSKFEKNDFKFEKFCTLRAPFFLSNP